MFRFKFYLLVVELNMTFSFFSKFSEWHCKLFLAVPRYRADLTDTLIWLLGFFSFRSYPRNIQSLGPGRTGQMFVYFAKKSVTSCLRQVRPVNFRSTKFCQSLPNFKDAVVLPQSRTNFCQAWNLTNLLIYTPWFEGKCQSRNLVGVLKSEAR